MAKSILGLFNTPAEVEPLGSVKAIDRWAAAQPASDPIGTVQAMVRLLEEACTAQRPLTADRLLALMELDRLSLAPQAQLQVQSRLPVLPEEVRQSIWQGRHDLARWLASAYEQAYEISRTQLLDARLREHLHGVCSRMFHYRGKQAQQGLTRHELWIPARWKFLHDAYKAASVQGLVSQPYSLVANPQAVERFSAEQEYLHLLLMQRSNSGNLSVPQIELASQWMRELVPFLKLETSPPPGDQYWLLNLARPEGLYAPPAAVPAAAAAETPDEGTDEETTEAPVEAIGTADPEVRYLDIAPIRTRLGALMKTLSGQLGPGSELSGRGEARARLALVKRLELALQPNAKWQTRRGERHRDKRAVLVAAGWEEIPLMMRKARPWLANEPVKYSYEGPAGTAALQGTGAPRRAKSVTIKEALLPEQRGWQVKDSSDSGLRIESRTRAAAQLQIGDLLVLLLEGESRWRIGLVRRLKRRTAEHTEIGVEVIAEHAVLVIPEQVLADDEHDISRIEFGHKPKISYGLYVPPQQRAQVAPVRSIIVQAADYQPSKIFSIEVEGQDNQIRFVLLIEQTKDWVWTTFDVVGAWREQVRI